MPAMLTLWRREMVRFFRQRNRVIGAFATPLIFWLFLGSGLNEAMTLTPVGNGEAAEQMGYLAYFFPGSLVLIVMFTAIFSTISVIEDRKEGFLQGVLVAPAPRLAIVLGKVLGGASIATIQGTVFVLLWAGTSLVWPAVGSFPGVAALLLSVVVMFVLGIGLTGLGLCLAWPMDSTAGFHAIMNLLLMPMWFLCGAVFPIAKAPIWMQAMMYANPLTYGHSVLSQVLQGADTPAASVPPVPAVVVMVLFGLALVLLAGKQVNKPAKA